MLASPRNARPSGPMTSIGPYSKDVEDFRPRRGQSGKREKSVKKNAALLHFLGFFPLTLFFGVPRGERLAAKTMAASLLRKPARAVIRPAGANIARSPVSLRSTVAPCSRPRNPLRRGCGVAQRSKPQWGFEPHERASSAGWRPSFWPPSALPRNSETFFATFFGHKKGRPNRKMPL